MQKILYVILTVLFLLPAFSISTMAANVDQTFLFDLSVDGKKTREVDVGDIITIVLKLHRTDSDKPYSMYAMQDEIRYDSNFFELVDSSAILSNGIAATDIASVDHYREFYMNYLSMSGGTQWDAEKVIGSFQLKVIAKSGVTQITNQNYLVSFPDGSGSYKCDANDITIILTTDCLITFMTNGGNRIPNQTIQYGEKMKLPEDPVKEGFSFDGWYKDINLTEKWDFDNDTVKGNMSLYAKWTIKQITDTVPENHVTSSFYLWLFLLFLIILLLILYYRHKKQNSY